MEQGLSLKLRLYPNADERQAFKSLHEQYRQACQYISEAYFESRFTLSRRELHDLYYLDIRDRFGLKSQQAASVLRTVLARYKSVNTQFKKEPKRYYDSASGKATYVNRDIDWLERPVQFHKGQADLVYKRDYRFTTDGRLRITTLGELVDVSFNERYFDKYLVDEQWKLGTAKLVLNRDKRFLHIGITKELPDYTKEQNQHVVGVDLGLRFLATTYDEKGETTFYSGKSITHQRRKYRQLRKELQSTNTTSSKRRLKAIGQRENCWMSDINHQLSKALVEKYGANTTFVVEDLSGITRNIKRTTSDNTADLTSWAFYEFVQQLTYKANLMGSQVVIVSAQYTSQRCPKCGQIDKHSRDHRMHHYHCQSCGYQSNDDRVGAMNLYELGKQYISGVKNPKFTKSVNAS